jgi:hypothetical protein
LAAGRIVRMGKSILKFSAMVCAMVLAGLLYMDWGSFEYNGPDVMPTYVHADGTPIKK